MLRVGYSALLIVIDVRSPWSYSLLCVARKQTRIFTADCNSREEKKVDCMLLEGDIKSITSILHGLLAIDEDTLNTRVVTVNRGAIRKEYNDLF